MLKIIHYLYNNKRIYTFFKIFIYSLIINVSTQNDIKSILNKKVDFIFSKFQNYVIASNTLKYKNTVHLNKITFLNLIQFNNYRTMINDNIIEIKDCIVTFKCLIMLKMFDNYYIKAQGAIFEYNITQFHLSYNSDNNSFDISNLKISPTQYSLINENMFKYNKEFLNDINITNGLFYNLTYNITYNHLKALCEDFNQLIDDFFNVINITEKNLKKELVENKLLFESFNTNHNQYYFTPNEQGILVNNVSFILRINLSPAKIHCYFENFYFGKNFYMHSKLLNNVSQTYTYIQNNIYDVVKPIFDKNFKKAKEEYYSK